MAPERRPRPWEFVFVFTMLTFVAAVVSFIVWRQPGGPTGVVLALWALTLLFCGSVMTGCVVLYERGRRERGVE